jgi:hypothetical protein
MKFRLLFPIALLLPIQVLATDAVVSGRVVTITLNPKQITVLHLRPEFDSTIRMPEEVTSVILGSPDEFRAEHSEGEPNFVYVKPITKDPAQSNLLIATKSGQQVSLELVSDGAGVADPGRPVDFLIEYRSQRSFLIPPDATLVSIADTSSDVGEPGPAIAKRRPNPFSALDDEFDHQARVNAPKWTKWDGKQIETSIGDIRQWNNETVIAYSILNASDRPVEIVPPQIQVAGRKPAKKKKEGKGVISDQLEIRDYRISTSRLEPGERADGVVVFDRPNFKQSTEQLFLQIAQADQVDQPVLIRIPFTPPIAADSQ